MSNSPYPIDPELTAIAIAYRNARMIADEVLPRAPVGKQEFKYTQYALAEGFTLPDTEVGRRGTPNQVEFSGQEKTDSTRDYALDAPVPQNDIDNAGPNQDPLGRAAEQTTNLIILARELRASKAVFNGANFGANNKVTLSGTSQWSDPTSKPLTAITDGLDSCVMRPNIGVLGRTTSTALRRHPQIVRAYNGTTGEDGLVPLQFLADLFELEAIFVGESRLNIANPGQSVNLQRVWGGHAAFIYRDKLADNQAGTTFGFTAEWRTRQAFKSWNKNIGAFGGYEVRVAESVKELVTAPDLGFFFENAVDG